MQAKIYDLRINSYGKPEPMNDGFFKHFDNLVSGYDESQYMMIGNYRVSKNDYLKLPKHKEAIDAFIQRKRKTL